MKLVKFWIISVYREQCLYSFSVPPIALSPSYLETELKVYEDMFPLVMRKNPISCIIKKWLIELEVGDNVSPIYRAETECPAWLKSLLQLKTKLASRLVLAPGRPPALNWSLKDVNKAATTGPLPPFHHSPNCHLFSPGELVVLQHFFSQALWSCSGVARS